jgi:TolB-like protein
MSEQAPHRRLAAILAADVVGYSRMMQADEAGTLAALKSRRADVLQPLVSRHHGRIVKLMGDGVLVEFGSAVAAVECAVELQQAMETANADLSGDRRIVLRIGINLGDVIIEGSDLYGDGVNIAARLEPLAEPGGICVSAKVHGEVAKKLRLAFDYMGEKCLKNMDEPIAVYRLLANIGAEPAARPASSSKPSIAVLPFTNMSGDPEQEYFSDGITEDIITELSRFRNLLVIARNSSFAYKGKSVNLAVVARELGADYVLEGSVRRAGNRIRVTAQLIDAVGGSHVWAERYDRELADIFEVQDELTRSIVGRLAIGLEDEALEKARRRRPDSMRAYEHWLRGKRAIWGAGKDNIQARRHFEDAIAVDPKFSRAYSGLAVTYQMEALEFPSSAEFKAAYEHAFECAEQALAMDEADYQAHIAMAWIYLYRGDYGRLEKHLKRGIALNPNDADSLANASYLFAMLGEADEGVRCGETAVRLNPRHPDWYLGFYSTALFSARQYADALAVRVRAPDVWIDSPFFGAAILSYLDRPEEARKWAERAMARLKATPGGAAAAADGCVQLLLGNNPWRSQEDRDHFVAGLRKAGLG